MDLLKTILLYLTMIFVSSVQTAPDASLMPTATVPAPTATAVVSATATRPLLTPTPTPVPTPAITPNDAYKTLKIGNRGDLVKAMQQRLKELGYFDGELDGAFGNQTRRAVERFQYYQGLSVDGIAGKRTLTVLYESADVVPAPTDATATPSAKPSTGPTAAITPSQLSETPLPTFVPAPSTAPLASQSLTPAPTDAADENVKTAATIAAVEAATAEPSQSAEPTVEPETSTPTLLTAQGFVIAGGTELLTASADVAAGAQGTLHPLQVGDRVYAPILEILKSNGVVVLPGNNPDRTEIAFALKNVVYQVSYTLDASGNVTDLKVLKNQQPQILSLRNAVITDSLLYLPMDVVTELTGVTFVMDTATNRYTVTYPAQ